MADDQALYKYAPVIPKPTAQECVEKIICAKNPFDAFEAYRRVINILHYVEKDAQLFVSLVLREIRRLDSPLFTFGLFSPYLCEGRSSDGMMHPHIATSRFKWKIDVFSSLYWISEEIAHDPAKQYSNVVMISPSSVLLNLEYQ